MKFACVVLANGSSKRFGTDKATYQHEGKTMVEHTIDRVKAQTLKIDKIYINRNEPIDGLDYELSPDDSDYRSFGPLSGILGAFITAVSNEYDYVFTVPCDSFVFPDDLFERMYNDLKSSETSVVFPMYNDQQHCTFGIWNVFPELPSKLRRFLRSMNRYTIRIFTGNQGIPKNFLDLTDVYPSDPFININTLEDINNL
ncbi:hypothetical protein PCE1_004798 [Barthelona sp. PCE]